MAEESTLLSIVIMPLIVAIIGFVGAIIAVFWKRIETWNKGGVFEKLIFRELEEFKPYPTLEKINEFPQKKKWTEHYQVDKNFIHKTIFQHPEQNMDMILGLDPNLVYNVSQLWDEIKLQYNEDIPNKTQFKHYWEGIIEYCSDVRRFKNWEKMNATFHAWNELIKHYDCKREGESKDEDNADTQDEGVEEDNVSPGVGIPPTG